MIGSVLTSIPTLFIQQTFEEFPIYLSSFVQDHPQHARGLQDNLLLLAQLEKAGLQTKENYRQAYLALSAYFGIGVQEKETVFENGTTLLHFAALGGQETLMDELLGDGFHCVDAMDVQGASFVHYLAMGGHVLALQRFGSVYDYEIDLHRIDESGKGIAEYAFLHKQIGVLEWLGEKKQSSIAVLYKGILESSCAENLWFYEDVGIKLLQWLDQNKYYERLQELEKPIQGIIFLFNCCLQCLREKAYLLSVIDIQLDDFCSQKEEELVQNIKDDVIKKMLMGYEASLNPLRSSRESSFKIRVLYLLDEMLRFKRFKDSRWNDRLPRYLGSGSFGTVYAVKSGDAEYAIKKAKLYNREYALREITWLNYFRAIDPKEKAPLVQKVDTVFWDTKLSIVMKLYRSSLNDHLKGHLQNKKNIPICVIQEILRQIFRACSFLKMHGLIHADIKPDNILVEFKTNRFVLADFDLLF